MAKTELQKVMKGGKVTQRQAKVAMDQAMRRLGRITQVSKKNKENINRTGAQVIYTAETQGSLFACSLGEGYLGTDKLELGGVDVRAPAGIGATAYGLYKNLSGDKTGNHAIAVGNGIVGSWLASVGVRAGQKLRDKWSKKDEKKKGTKETSGSDSKALPKPEVNPDSPKKEPPAEPEMGANLREILYSEPAIPEPMISQPTREKPDNRPRDRKRFVRARSR